MDFRLDAATEELRARVRAHVSSRLIPLEADPATWGERSQAAQQQRVARRRVATQPVGSCQGQERGDRGGLPAPRLAASAAARLAAARLAASTATAGVKGRRRRRRRCLVNS